MITLIKNIIEIGFSFYAHNAPLVWYSLGVFVALLRLVYKPQRAYVFLFLGFLTLIFSFEYQKHFIEHTQTHVTEAIFTEEFGEATIARGNRLTTSVLPLVMDVTGWGLILGTLLLTNLAGSGHKSTTNS